MSEGPEPRSEPSEHPDDDASVNGLDVVVVLCEPQDPINIGTCVRAMRNMGLEHLRLVRPANFDPRSIIISAPRSEAFIEGIEVVETLDEALADVSQCVALSARGRRERGKALRPREAAPLIVERARNAGRVALLFGREDSGLSNAEVDRADLIVTIPAVPDYASLNLGQAVLVMAYELFVTCGTPAPLEGPRRRFEPANGAELEGLFAQIVTTMRRVEFLDDSTESGVMRALRAAFFRADLDKREYAILRGMFAQVVKFLRRRGLE